MTALNTSERLRGLKVLELVLGLGQTTNYANPRFSATLLDSKAIRLPGSGFKTSLKHLDSFWYTLKEFEMFRPYRSTLSVNNNA